MTPWITWTLVLLMVCARLVSMVIVRRRFRRWEDLQQVRTRFACVRRDMIALVDAGELDPRSKTFHLLYLMSSAMIRRSHAYPDVARHLLIRIGRSPYHRNSPEVTELLAEAKLWSPAVVKLARDFNEAMYDLCVRFNWPLRIIAAVDRAVNLRRLFRLGGAVMRRIPRLRTSMGQLFGIAFEAYRTSRDVAQQLPRTTTFA